MLQGRSYRDKKSIVSIIDTVLKPSYVDTKEIKSITGKVRVGSLNKHLKKAYPTPPNLYYFFPAPQNSSSPLYARQYEKVKLVKRDEFAGDQFHRIHPLTKSGLDLEHFYWVRWSINGDVNFVDDIDPAYHGKDYWIVPDLKEDKKRGGYHQYAAHYNDLFNKYSIPRANASLGPFHSGVKYETEYKLLIPGGHNAYNDTEQLVRVVLDEKGFKIRDSKTKSQKDIYFDDEPNKTLHAVGASFRLRKKRGENTRVTLKKRFPYKGYSETGLYDRIEEEVVITRKEEDNLKSGQGLNSLPYRLLSYIAPGLDVTEFREVLNVTNMRTSKEVESPTGGRIEVCIDRITYNINRTEHKYLEVEIEGKGAPHDEVKELAEILEKDLGAIPSQQTKYERGISLIKTSKIDRQEEKELVIIDTDTGVDDALALILALKTPKLDVKAITTVAGNVSEDKVFQNVWKVLSRLSMGNMPIIARGAVKPIKRSLDGAPSVHGNDGLGDVYNPPSDMGSDVRPAWKVICELAKEHENRVTLITLGPMTNAALAIQKDPEGFACLKQVVAMGGVFSAIGNVGADAEFNIGSDPDAARIVVEFCRNSCLKTAVWRHQGGAIEVPTGAKEEDYQGLIDNRYPGEGKTYWDWHRLVKYEDSVDPERKQKMVPLIFVGLDVTHKVILRKHSLERAIKAHQTNRLLPFIRDISAKYMDFYNKNEGIPGCYLHDPLAVAYVINPAFLEMEEHIIRVETKGEYTTGVMFPDDRPTRNPAWRNPAEAVIKIASKVEREAFEEWFMSILIS